MFNSNQNPIQQTQLISKRFQITEEIRRQKRNLQFVKRRNQNLTVGSFADGHKYNHLFPSLSDIRIKQQITKLRIMIESRDQEKVKQGLACLRKLMYEVDPSPIQTVLDVNVLPIILQHAYQNNDIKCKIESCWIIANMCSGTHQVCCVLMKNGLISLFNNCLNNQNIQLHQQIMFALGNLSADCEQFRKQIINSKILQKIIHLFQSNNLRLLEILSWFIGNLSKVKDFYNSYNNHKNVFLGLCRILQNKAIIQNFNDVFQVAYTIAFFINRSQQAKNVIIVENIIPNINILLSKQTQEHCIISLMRILGNLLISQNQKHVSQVLKSGSLPIIESFLDLKYNFNVIKQVTWIFSNVAAQGQYSIQIFQNEKLRIKLLQHFQKTQIYSIKKQLGWLFNNICQKCDSQIIFDFFIENNLINQYIFFLDYPQKINLIEIGLKGIDSILYMTQKVNVNYHNQLINKLASSVAPTLNQLMLFPSQDISNMCRKILLFFDRSQENNS